MATGLLGKYELSIIVISTNLCRCDKPGPKGKNEIRIMVNLDEEKGRRPRDPPDIVYCVIRQTKIIKMAVIKGYLTRQMAFDSTVLEAISELPVRPRSTELIVC